MMSGSPAPTILQRLGALRQEVLAVGQRNRASNLRVYSSIAKATEHNGSDLDLLVDLSRDQTLLGLISLRHELENLLGCPVDGSEADSLQPLIRSEMLRQAWEL
jgi:predicted nucleotidyltransferase